VTSRREFSPQTLSVLAALCEQPSRWQHGYALASTTGLKSGTLYPILIRLADRGLVEARWQEEAQPGRPRRHLYRLTADGLASATGALAGPAQQPARRPATAAGARRPGERGVTEPSVPSAREPAGRGVREPAGRGARQRVGQGVAAPAVP
jgi:PadR family transcriptional regulator, regulatory protein PadR